MKAAWILTMAALAAAGAGRGLAAGDIIELSLAGGRVTVTAPGQLNVALGGDSPDQPFQPCADRFHYCLYLPSDSGSLGDASAAGMSISERTGLRGLTSCLLSRPPTLPTAQPGVVLLDRWATSRFDDVVRDLEGGQATGEVLRLHDGESCWEFETRIVTAEPSNSLAGGGVLEGGEERVGSTDGEATTVLRQVLASVRLADGTLVTWPSQGRGDLSEFVRVDLPEVADSPLVLVGMARGTWYFEGDFPVRLISEDGEVLAEGFVTAQDEWMTEGFVPFAGELEFSVEEPTSAILELERANPSGLPEHEAAARYRLTLR